MFLNRDAVGKPVARLPPHRSLHEVFPHKAPRLDSLPCQAVLRISVTDSVLTGSTCHPSRCAIPHSEVGSCDPILRVRQKFPVWAASFRTPLSHVEVFLPFRVLRVHPPPRSMSFPDWGTPLMFSPRKKKRDNLRGFPSSCVCLFVHATVYGELRQSFTSSHSRVASAFNRVLIADALVLVSVCVITLTD